MAMKKERLSANSRTFRTSTRSGKIAALPWWLSLLALPSLLTPTANALCGVQFDYPTPGSTFYYLDTINVTYHSNFSEPQLYLFCSPSAPVQKFKTAATPFNGSTLVLVNLTITDSCWFDLKPGTGACGDNSPSFSLSANQRFGGQPTTLGLSSPSSTPSQAPSPTASTSATDTATPPIKGEQSDPPPDNDLTPGAKAGLGIAIAGVVAAVGAMVAFFYFRRRRRVQDANVAGVILDHDRRNGRRGPEKRPGTESVSSGRSEEPLNPIQPIFDGYPGSTGYDDVRSLHSSTHLHSPTWPQSPSSSHQGVFFPPTERPTTEREELTAARLHSSATLPTVVSYGPNRVTPTLTPRPSDLNVRSASISVDSREGIPPMPEIPMPTSYAPYQPAAPPPTSTPSPPKKTVPLVVSYGPNRVTPTPPIKSSIPPPDDAVMRNFADWSQPMMPPEGFYSNPRPQPQEEQPVHQELDPDPQRFSFEGGDDMYSSMGPLPPYATSADFFAMEKGAIRKMAEPQAQAELPPTKDGYYHDRVDIQEYELPGAAPQNEPQLPFNPLRNQPQGGIGRSGGIDEQKFLLDDAEMAHLREQKRKIRAAQLAAAAAAASEPGEAYEMTQTAYTRSTAGPS